MHQPTCLRTSGKAVPAGVDTAAASAAEQREAIIERELNTQRQKLANLETAREEAVLDRFMSGEWKVQQLQVEYAAAAILHNEERVDKAISQALIWRIQ